MKSIITSILVLISLITFGQKTQVEELSKLYMSGDYNQTIIKANEFLKNDPNNIDYKLILGRALTDKSEFKEAISYLDYTVNNDKDNNWRKAWALSYLGTCYFMLQDYNKSESSLNECINLNATKNATNNAYGQTLLFGFNEFYKTWKIVETDNFRFHFQNMNDTEIEKYITLREKAYKRINDFFKSTLPKKIEFYVWESKEDAKKTLRADLSFARPSLCVVQTHYQHTIGHEMTHVISHYTTDISTNSKFINEGTSVSFDLSAQDRLKLVKDWTAKNNKKIDIIDFWGNGNEYSDEILYPLSGLFVKELIDKFGREKFIEFFGNQTYNNAKLVFGDKLDELIKDIENKINT